MSVGSPIPRRVMGTSATIMVHGGHTRGGVEPLFGELARLERCWSRFRPDSELNRMNALAGNPVIVSSDLFTLVRHLVSAHRRTEGRFDPTMRDRMIELGYDRTYRKLATAPRPAATDHPTAPAPVPVPVPRPSDPAASCEAIELIATASMVVLPAGVALDPGGLGKGLAADLVAAKAMAAGAGGVMVEIGGDIVTRGTAPDGGPWRIAVPATATTEEREIELHDGAVATSDTAARVWFDGEVERRHILDPASGGSIDDDRRATVVAGAGWWAEAVATAAIVSMARRDGWLDRYRETAGAAMVLVDEESPADV